MLFFSNVHETFIGVNVSPRTQTFYILNSIQIVCHLKWFTKRLKHQHLCFQHERDVQGCFNYYRHIFLTLINW